MARAEHRAARSEGGIAPLASDAAAGDGTGSQMGMRRLPAAGSTQWICREILTSFQLGEAGDLSARCTKITKSLHHLPHAKA